MGRVVLRAVRKELLREVGRKAQCDALRENAYEVYASEAANTIKTEQIMCYDTLLKFVSEPEMDTLSAVRCKFGAKNEVSLIQPNLYLRVSTLALTLTY